MCIGCGSAIGSVENRRPSEASRGRPPRSSRAPLAPVLGGQLLAPLGPPRREHAATGLGAHSGAKTVLLGTMPLLGLVRLLGHDSPRLPGDCGSGRPASQPICLCTTRRLLVGLARIRADVRAPRRTDSARDYIHAIRLRPIDTRKPMNTPDFQAARQRDDRRLSRDRHARRPDHRGRPVSGRPQAGLPADDRLWTGRHQALVGAAAAHLPGSRGARRPAHHRRRQLRRRATSPASRARCSCSARCLRTARFPCSRSTAAHHRAIRSADFPAVADTPQGVCGIGLAGVATAVLLLPAQGPVRPRGEGGTDRVRSAGREPSAAVLGPSSGSPLAIRRAT